MKKTGKSAPIILIVAIVLVSIRFIFGGPEDDRICSSPDGSGQWIPHGNPSAPIPTTPFIDSKVLPRTSENSGRWFFCKYIRLSVCGVQHPSVFQTGLTNNDLAALPSNSNTMGKINILADRENSGQIPSKYTCDGDDEFPILMLSNVPANTQSLALIVDDPDAPVGVRDHYVLANIPNLGTEFEINPDLEKQSTLGKNGRGDTRRGGPCPPNGEHRYFFKIYALDIKLPLKKGFRKSELLSAMQGHTIGTGEIIGLYTRK